MWEVAAVLLSSPKPLLTNYDRERYNLKPTAPSSVIVHG
jgi:hypothetical protein